MKKKLTRNIGLKILSVLLAVILWIVITNVDNPVKTKTFTNVPVKILNENIISTPNQSYEILEGEKIDFKVAARRSVIDTLSEADFDVTADFSHLNESNSVNIDIVSGRSDVTITEGSKRQYMTISKEQLSEEDFKVNVVQKGEYADGYYISEKLASPNIIRVSGPKRRIEKIKEVIVEVDVTDISRSTTKIAVPKALDEGGKEIDAARLSFSNKYIYINLKVLNTKEVDLQVRTSGEPAAGYVVTGVKYQPDSIMIAAEDNILESTSSIQVTEDISGASQNIEKEINLQDFIPSGIIIVQEDKTAVIHVTVERLETKEITIWPNDIELRHMSSVIRLSDITKGPIIIEVIGPINEIEDLTRNTLKPYIDLSGYKAGYYILQIQADLSKNSSIHNNANVQVYLSPSL